MTKLSIQNGKSKAIARILEGIEGFCIETENGEIEKWVSIKGAAMRFEEAPGEIQRKFGQLFINDKRGQGYLQQMGITSFREGFNKWYFCLLGGIDFVSDIVDGQLVPDAFNNICTDYNCSFRGKFCGRKSKLMNYEVATLSALKQGLSISETANMLSVSEAGVKSRIVTLKEKLGARNMAHLTAIATQIGI